MAVWLIGAVPSAAGAPPPRRRRPEPLSRVDVGLAVRAFASRVSVSPAWWSCQHFLQISKLQTLQRHICVELLIRLSQTSHLQW
jgi:hypothetical protein